MTPARFLSIVARLTAVSPRPVAEATKSRVLFFNQPERDIMGKGDNKTRRGKIFKGSYGKTRPHRAEKKPAARVKTPGKRG